nr:hypothetical protein 11 - Synechococcus sp. (PCC 6716) [Synechococcus sp.]CAA49887.1 unnamed protein product [Synechococcus sp.]
MPSCPVVLGRITSSAGASQTVLSGAITRTVITIAFPFLSDNSYS